MTDRLVLTRLLDERPVQIYERTQMVWLGSFMAPVVVECFYKLPAPPWPKVQIRARRRLAGLRYRLGLRTGIMLDNEAFNAAFKVTSRDEEFAIMLLSPELQAYILDKPTVDWSAGGGSIKLWYRGRLNKKRVDQALERLAGFDALITPELLDWA